jgi:hypothetical protein
MRPAPAPRYVIAQSSLQTLSLLREEKKQLHARLRQVDQLEDDAVATLLDLLDRRASVEAGPFSVRRTESRRRTIAWKAVCVEHLGPEAVESVEANHPVTVTVGVEVVPVAGLITVPSFDGTPVRPVPSRRAGGAL